MNCFRYLGITDIDKIYSLTPTEYTLLMKAHSLAEVDRNHTIHKQAWANQSAKATKEKGKKQVSAYKDFSDFFDYEKEVKRIEKIYKKKPIPKEKIMKFKDSVKYAEKLLNGGR